MDERHQAAGDHRAGDADNDAVGRQGSHHTGIGTGKHHAFHSNINNTAAFRNNASQGRQQEQRSEL